MEDRLRWILPVPFLIFGIGAWLYFETENEVRVQMVRAQDQWRRGEYARAAELYESVYRDYPKSRYADQALWEIGTIHYVNFYDVDKALRYFQELVSQYPDSPLAGEACMKLAEIHANELNDLAQSLKYLEYSLRTNVSADLRRRVLFEMGNAHVKLNQFDVALGKFRLIVTEGADKHMVEQALARVGAILQIQNEYEESVGYFQRVLNGTTCDDCRLSARLGLIESYEFMGEFRKAIETARDIQATDYSEDMKQDLLQRLSNKARYYAPGLLE